MAWDAYAAAVLADNPKAFYPMDDLSGAARDRSANALHCTTTAGTLTYRQAGPITNALAINSANTSGGISRGLISTAVDNCTVELWSKLTAGTTQNVMAMGTVGGWYTQLVAGGKFHIVRGNGQTDSVATVLAGTWQYWVAVCSSNVWSYYLNGVLDQPNGGSTNSVPSGNFELYSAGAGGTGYMFSNMAFYETALAPSRIRAHYEAAQLSDDLLYTASLAARRSGTARSF